MENVVEDERVSGFHSVFDGPSVRIATGSLLALPGRVASAHELAHQRLTATTAFGRLMQLRAVIERTDPGRPAILHRLGGQCRTVHESLATFESVWMMADGDLCVLAGSPEYLSWYRDAAEVAPLADHTRLKLLVVQQIAEACLNGPVLEGLTRLGAEDPAAWQVAAVDRPDRRLALLYRVPSEFWSELGQQCRELLGQDAWPVFAPAAPSPAALTRTFQQDFDPLVSRLVDHLGARLAMELERHGARTAEPSGELEHAINVVEAAVPASRGRMKLSSSLSLSEEVVEQFFRERILLSDEPRPARLFTFDEHFDRPFVHPANEADLPVIYISVRGASRLLDQFAFPEQDRRQLAALGNTVVTSVVTHAPGGDCLLLRIQEPEEMADLADLLDGRARIYVSWSMASMAEATRNDPDAADVSLATAVRALEVADFSLALLDFAIVAALRGWAQQQLPVRYATRIVRVGDIERLHLVTMQLPGRNDVIVVLCGGHQTGVLRDYLDGTYPDATWDAELLTPYGEKALRRILPLILESEHVIDYRALLMTRRMS